MTNDQQLPLAARRRPGRRAWLNLVLVLGLLLAGVLLVTHRPPPAHAATRRTAPHSAAMERLTGVRFTRVAVVGDGGLLELSYVVVDPELATKFQTDRDHPPRLSSESRSGGTQRASIMRGGHQVRAGQTYYLVYENTRGAIRSDEQASVTWGGVVLHHLPVL